MNENIVYPSNENTIEHLNSSEFAQATTMDTPSTDSSSVVNLQVNAFLIIIFIL